MPDDEQFEGEGCDYDQFYAIGRKVLSEFELSGYIFRALKPCLPDAVPFGSKTNFKTCEVWSHLPRDKEMDREVKDNSGTIYLDSAKYDDCISVEEPVDQDGDGGVNSLENE